MYQLLYFCRVAFDYHCPYWLQLFSNCLRGLLRLLMYLSSSILLSITSRGRHRCALPVLCYPKNMAIYHYPPIGVLFMVILHVFIIKNYPNLFSNYYPKYTIWVIYPFLLNLGEFIYKILLNSIERGKLSK